MLHGCEPHGAGHRATRPRQNRAVIAAVDELETAGTLGDISWASLREHLADEQIIELVIELVIVHGWYRMIAAMGNALDLGVEDWLRPWPT